MSKPSNKLFAKRLKQLRKNAGLSQQALADKLKITKSTLSNYESGIRIPDINILLAMVELFEVTSDFLLGRTDVSALDESIEAACNYTYLSDSAIMRLRENLQLDNMKRAITSAFLSSETFYELIEHCIHSITVSGMKGILTKICNYLKSQFNNPFLSGVPEKGSDGYITNEMLSKWANEQISIISIAKCVQETTYYYTEDFFFKHDLHDTALFDILDTTTDNVDNYVDLQNYKSSLLLQELVQGTECDVSKIFVDYLLRVINSKDDIAQEYKDKFSQDIMDLVKKEDK